jgi:LacI family transcriptional regulator
MQNHQHRFSALKTALRLRGVALERDATALMKHAERLDGYTAAKQLVEAGKRRAALPTAWVCYNGSMARGATVYLLERGLHLPQDVSLAAVDMSRICTETPPYITSAFASPEDMGRTAAELLLARGGSVEGTFSDLVLPSTLEVRQSTGRPVREPRTVRTKSKQKPRKG